MSEFTTPTQESRCAAVAGGGPVNPFARKVAALRAAFVETITEQHIREITYVILLRAQGGELPWIKLLFQYAIGRPQPAVNPDTLALEEMRLLQQSAVPPEVIAQMQGGLPASFAVELCRLTQAAREAEAGQLLLDAIAADDQKKERREANAQTQAERKQRRAGAAAPSTNGDDGETLEGERENGPSTNGDDGHGGLASLLGWLRDRRRPSGGGPRT
jgi:hypothetical protein